METNKCFICDTSLETLGEKVVNVSRGLKTLIAASQERNDGKAENLKLKECVVVHESCRKRYTRKDSIKKDRKNVVSQDESRTYLRSAVTVFDFKQNCLFCGKEASKEQETKRAIKHRKIINDVSTLTFQNTIMTRCQERCDEWSKHVEARINSVQDLVAAEAKYHSNCRLTFFSAPKLGLQSGRTKDLTKNQSFEMLLHFIENNDECQFTMDELLSYVNTISGTSSAPTECYGRQYLKDKLKAHYGTAVVVTDIPGKSSIVNFKGTADKLLLDKWYENKKESETKERLRIVERAANIIRDDIRQKVYDCDNYASMTASSISNENILPDTLQLFLDVIITAKKYNRKKTAIGQALISACRPRSFVPPVLLAVGVYIHRRFESKQLVQLLNSLGFSVNIIEVHKLEYSLLQQKHPYQSPDQFSQFVFDNADFNTRTLDGHNTFHCMGGIQCTTPASTTEPRQLPRIKDVPKAEEIAAKGKFDINWLKHPNKSGLKNINIKDYSCVSAIDASKHASLIDTLWLCGRWSGVQSPPSWNGYMKASMDIPSDIQTTDIEALPFINLQPSDPSTIYTALLYAAKMCMKQGQKTCFVTFDQPLYVKAVDIVASDKTGELQNVIIRLGGFHMLMSFLGSIGYFMMGSGIEELWAEIYAKSSVPHMMSGHAYARSLRAHFLTQQALATMMLEKLSDDLTCEKNEIQSLFQEFQEHTVAVEDLISSTTLHKIQNSIEQLSSELSENSRTARLWIEYFQQSNTLNWEKIVENEMIEMFRPLSAGSLSIHRLNHQVICSQWPQVL